MTSTPSKSVPSDEMLARAWHALSDEALDGIAFDGEECRCRNFVPYARRVLELFYGEPEPEPDGLGAVVVNPFSDGVWVRSAHPALPWYDPESDSSQQWSDPTCEGWFTWDDLPRPLVVESPGWTPPEPQRAPAPARDHSEPTGIGAVVVDAADDVWVRVQDGSHPWVNTASGVGQVAGWDDLVEPVLRSHGWYRR